MIDPWKFLQLDEYKDAWYGGARARNQEDMDALHEFVVDRFRREIEEGSVAIHRTTSTEAANHFDDEYFDWIYIDGDHKYESVKQDLELYLTKVKVSGYIAGDDYETPGWWGSGVKDAVDEFTRLGRAELIVVKRNQFVLRKR